MRHPNSKRRPHRHLTLHAAAIAAPLLAMFALVALAPRAECSGSPSPPKQDRPAEPAATPTKGEPADSAAMNAEAKALRAKAEEAYAKGYAESEDAKALLKAGKEKDAKKKFGKAL